MGLDGAPFPLKERAAASTCLWSCLWLVLLRCVPAGAAFSTGRIHVKWKPHVDWNGEETEKQEHAPGDGRCFPDERNDAS